MIPELNEVNYINRLDGVPLFYSSRSQGPYNSFEYFPTSAKKLRLSSPINQDNFILTPPLSPNYQNHQTQTSPQYFRRSSVIMKVENQIIRPIDKSPADHEVCKWVNCYR